MYSNKTLHAAVPQVQLNTEAVQLVADHRGSQRRRGFAKRLAARLRAWRHGATGAAAGTMFVPAHAASHNVSVPAADFSGWLLRNARPEDRVVIHMDIAGAHC